VGCHDFGGLGILDKAARPSKLTIASCSDSALGIEGFGATLPGIRHGLVEDSKTVAPDRQLVSCSIDRGLSKSGNGGHC
jgi:hypothetical protein